MKKIIGLIIVVVSSFLMIYSYQMTSMKGQYDSRYDLAKLLGPGIIFSLYLIVVRFNELSSVKSFFYFIILLVTYISSLIVSMTTWGIAVPFAGGLGAFVVKSILNQTIKIVDPDSERFFIKGFVCGLLGVGFFFLVSESQTDGVGFGIILVFWQLFIGLEFLKGVIQKAKN